MKVLIFSTAYFPFVGGAEVSVKELTDRMGSEIEFDLITARLGRGLPDVEKIGLVTVHRIGVGVPLVDKFFLPYFGAAKAWQLHRQNHYDYFWCIMATFASGAAYIANWFQKKVPIVLTLQEGDSEQYLKFKWFGLIDLSWRLALNRTEILTAISTYLLDRARKLGYKGESHVIPNGVDVEKFGNVQNSILHKEGITLITTSRLVKKNAVGDIIEAMRFLPENVRLKILGTGPLEKNLKLRIKNLKLEGRVEMLGFVPQDEIPQHLHSSDIFIRPSLSEGMGNSFIEAMAAGLPVIATPVGGIPDFLIDGETGLFVEPESPRLIAFQVQKLISDRVLRDKMVINAKRMVREHYDWNLIAKEMKGKVFVI
ncbi:MAG: glycosyltransferase family 4 protein [Patescibacteria group bacterium]